MSEWLLPIVVAAAALALTYVFCVRPMRRGHRVHSSPAAASTRGNEMGPDDLASALQEARTELARLRSQNRGVLGDAPA